MKKFIDTNNLNQKVRPGKDFYKYAVGGWLSKYQIPEDKSVWSTFHVLREDNLEKLHALVRDAKKKKKLTKEYEKMTVNFYASGMHARRNRLGISPLADFLHEIMSIEDEQEFAAYIGLCHEIGVNAFWQNYIEPDEKQTETMALYYAQGGLTLPDREYYLSREASYTQVRGAYKKHFIRMGKYVEGVGTPAFEKSVFRIEKFLAQNARTKIALRDVHAQYNKLTRKKLHDSAPHIAFDVYEDFAQIPKTTHVIVGQPEYLQSVSDAQKKFTLTERKAYLLWRTLCTFAPYLSEGIRNDHFAFFGKVISGIKKPQAQWKGVVQTLDMHIGDALGQMYVAKHFPPRAHKAADALVVNVKKAFEQRLTQLTWMSPSTKKKALLKLHAMNFKIGHTTKWEVYEDLLITADDYLGNVMRSRIWTHRTEMKKIGKIPDPTQWEMTAPTVNAYYHPLLNEMVFPAGILQAPFFDAGADAAMNYGGIGTVIAHEITHGFDDQGSLYDKDGNIKAWWNKTDQQLFGALTKKIIAQYDAFEALPGLHVQGALTVGENIADLGGLMIGLEAYHGAHPTHDRIGKDGFTGTQRFMLAYALTEATKIRPQELRRLVVIDPHSPSEFRVVGPLSHMDAFYDAFEIRDTDPIYRSPKERVVIW